MSFVRYCLLALIALTVPVAAFAQTVGGELKVPTDKCADQTVRLVNGQITRRVSRQSGAAYDACTQHGANCSQGICECGKTYFYELNSQPYGKGVDNCSPTYAKEAHQLEAASGISAGSPVLITKDNLIGIDPSNAQDQARMSQMLQALGASPQYANAAVQAQPQQTLSFLNQVANGNSSAASQPFAQEFHLDPQLINAQVGQIEPFLNTQNPVTQANGQYVLNTSVCGETGYYGGIINMESRCGTITSPANRAYCDAQGPGQYICSTWTQDAIQSGHSELSDPSYRFDPNAVRTVTNDWYSNVWQPQNAAACNAANLDLRTCAYLYHWNGNMKFVQALPSIDQNTSIATLCGEGMLSSCSANPKLVYQNANYQTPYTVGGMLQNISNNVGGSGSYYVENIPAPAVSKGTLCATAYGTCNYPWGAPQQPAASPNGYAPQNGQNQFQQMQLMMMLMGPLQNLFRSAGTINQPSSPAQPSPLPLPAPTAAISALPNPVLRGSPVSVSWSSDGTSLSQVCEVKSADGLIIGQGNGGTDSVSTGTSTPSSLTFTVYCTGANGQQVQQSASVSVE